MKTTTWIIIILIVLIGGYFLLTPSEPVNEGPIKIGALAPLSDIFAAYGEDIRSGILSAKTDDVEFVFEDTKCEAKEAVSAFKKLTDFENISFIIGPACGSPQDAIAPLLKDQKMFAIVSSAASENLYEKSGGNMFNMQYTLDDESKFVADKMFEMGYKKVLLIGYQNAFSQTHTKSFKKNFKGEIMKEFSFLNNETDVSTEITKIKDLEIDAVYVTDTAFFFADGLSKLRRFGVDVPVFSQYAVEHPSVVALAEGVIYSFPEGIGEDGAIKDLSKQASELMTEFVVACEGNYECVRDKFDSSDQFDDQGVSTRSIILKQIKNGEFVKLEK